MISLRWPDWLRGSCGGRRGLLIARSPWLSDDLAATGPEWDGAVLVGVNFAILKNPFLDFCLGGDPKFYELVQPEKFPETTFLTSKGFYHEGLPGNVYPYEILSRASTINSVVAVYLCAFLGIENLRIVGAHFTMKDDIDAEYYGDIKVRDIFPDRIEAYRYLRRERSKQPMCAATFVHAVECIREQGVKVDWPGEECARERATVMPNPHSKYCLPVPKGPVRGVVCPLHGNGGYGAKSVNNPEEVREVQA